MSTAASRAKQRRDALALANQTRTAGVALCKEIGQLQRMAGLRRLANLIGELPPAAGGLRVDRMLCSVRGYGREQAGAVADDAQLRASALIGPARALTVNERIRLTTVLRGRAAGKRQALTPAEAVEEVVDAAPDPEKATWVDGPGLVVWLYASHAIEPDQYVAATRLRRIDDWRNGALASVELVDELLCELGTHLTRLPDELWRARGRSETVDIEPWDKARAASAVREGRSTPRLEAKRLGVSESIVTKWAAKLEEPTEPRPRAEALPCS